MIPVIRTQNIVQSVCLLKKFPKGSPASIILYPPIKLIKSNNTQWRQKNCKECLPTYPNIVLLKKDCRKKVTKTIIPDRAETTYISHNPLVTFPLRKSYTEGRNKSEKI